jgi:predicted nucleic-acid-binding protein
VIGLDTNVLVRFFVQDNTAQNARVDEVFASLSADEPGWIGLITLAELTSVMTRIFKVSRAGMIQIMDHLLSLPEIVFEHRDIVVEAFLLYRTKSRDFADCLIACSARAAGCSGTVTFDRRAARDAGMELLV